MDLGNLNEDFRRNLIYLGVILLLVIGFMGVKNLVTPNDPVRVGYTEVTTECVGIDTGVCLGFEKRDHTSYNYDNYTEPEEGTENYYRRIESELMIRAYNTCNASMSGMEWTDHVEYRNRTATEWLQEDSIELLPCEKSFWRDMTATE